MSLNNWMTDRVTESLTWVRDWQTESLTELRNDRHLPADWLSHRQIEWVTEHLCFWLPDCFCLLHPLACLPLDVVVCVCDVCWSSYCAYQRKSVQQLFYPRVLSVYRGQPCLLRSGKEIVPQTTHVQCTGCDHVSGIPGQANSYSLIIF